MSELIRILGLTRNGMSSTVHMKRIESLQGIRLVTWPIILKISSMNLWLAHQSESRILNPLLSLFGHDTNSWRKFFYDLIGHVTNQILCKDSRVGKGSKFYMLEAIHWGVTIAQNVRGRSITTWTRRGGWGVSGKSRVGHVTKGR